MLTICLFLMKILKVVFQNTPMLQKDGSFFIVHLEVWCPTEKKSSFYKLPEELMLKDVNVLGAGDIFASCFLYKLLEGYGDIRDWIEYSHLTTTEILKSSK